MSAPPSRPCPAPRCRRGRCRRCRRCRRGRCRRCRRGWRRGCSACRGSSFFPGLFVLARRGLAAIAGCPQSRATVLAARLVSSVQAVMASTAGLIISSSCQRNVIDDRHWLAWAYPSFAVPYFVYDVYAMYLCHLCRAQVKGHGPRRPGPARAAAAFLRQELLMVLHHLAMVLVCFPVATLWRQGKGDFFLGCLLMAELSTPFVCLGKVLIL
ncbi:LOW QUALITY PROTEIN: ceramide synthase-like, partial [Ammospiza maritima maritima]